MKIDTGDATPKYQPVRHTPFAARQEIAEQLKQMQDQILANIWQQGPE